MALAFSNTVHVPDDLGSCGRSHTVKSLEINSFLIRSILSICNTKQFFASSKVFCLYYTEFTSYYRLKSFCKVTNYFTVEPKIQSRAMKLHFGVDLAPKQSQDSTLGAISILKQVLAVLFRIFGFTGAWTTCQTAGQLAHKSRVRGQSVPRRHLRSSRLLAEGCQWFSPCPYLVLTLQLTVGGACGVWRVACGVWRLDNKLAP